MPTPQYFKGDATELKYYNAGKDELDLVSTDKDDFLAGAYGCFKLGELLWDNNLAPLANAIPREIFRECFAELFEGFQVAGTFESYLDVFRKIFGNDVDIEFTVPAPGKLNIAIAATGTETKDFIARRIESNAWVNDNVNHQGYPADADTDYILFRSIKGFQTQYELEQMLFEMVPAGIYTEITLTLGA